MFCAFGVFKFSNNISIFICLFIENYTIKHVLAYEVGCDAKMKPVELGQCVIQHC